MYLTTLRNDFIVEQFLRERGIYPEPKAGGSDGLRLRMDQECLLLRGAPDELIGLADLLVSLALSGEPQGQHWHVDSATLVDEASEIKEIILLRE